VWLNADLLSPYDYWQYWRNTRTATSCASSSCSPLLPLDEIERLAAAQGQEVNEAKKVLATEATALVHGRAAATTPPRPALRTFEEGALAATLRPWTSLGRARRRPRRLAAFVKAGLVASNGEARPADQERWLRMNDDAVTDEKMMSRPRTSRRRA